MNFSKFFKYSLPFFLLCLLANSARPIGFKDSSLCVGKPLYFEIPMIPQASPYAYKSILIDKGNRLFITNDHNLFIYDGVNLQQISITDDPVVTYDGESRVAVAGVNYLSILTLNHLGEYSVQSLIDSSTIGFKHQITSIGFGSDKNIYFSTGTKLWTFKEKPTPIDSSDQKIKIFSTHIGLVFFSADKGFYTIEGKSVNTLSRKYNFSADDILAIADVNDNLVAITQYYPWVYSINGGNRSAEKINRHIKPCEKILWAKALSSYFFIATSSPRLLIFDLQGKLVKQFIDYESFNFDLPIDISTSDDINFFAITPTQIFRFINPLLVQVYNARDYLKGSVKSAKIFNNTLYIATTCGFYAAKNLDQITCFELLEEGEFHDIYSYSNQLFTTGSKGLYQISDNRVNRVSTESEEFSNTYLSGLKYPKAFFLNRKGFYFTYLKPPFTLHEIRIDDKLPFTNLYPSDSLLLLKSVNGKWYYCNLVADNIFLHECSKRIDSKTSFNQFIANGDTLTTINNRIAKIEKSGIKLQVGKAHTEQHIYSFYSRFHPDYQTLMVEKGSSRAFPFQQKAVIALNNTFIVNAALLDPDSTYWISTNQGLIKVSKDYQKYLNSPPDVKIFSLSYVHKGFSTPLYYGYTQWLNSLKTEYRVKEGYAIEIHLSGLGTYGWNDLVYSFKYDNPNSKWSEWTTNAGITLSKLTSGSNTIKIKARDVLGIESQVLTISLKVIPNFFQTQFTLVALLILILLIILATYRWRNYYHALERFKLECIINRRTEELIKEKEKTDNLLARVLPSEMAAELKETGKVNAQKFNLATVLFSDIQGFTKITDELNPESLIDQLDKFFLYFDSVVDKYRIEKIKTIGDAYMCAGGIPHKNRTNPVEVVLAALEMMQYMKQINLDHNLREGIWDLRIGIDTGPVIAGVVGRNKLSYDIWGTTVNTASRMESSGEVGKINISGNTHIFVQDYFLFTYRGKMPIKNKGDIEMYFVDGIKPELSNNLDIYKPNREFQFLLQFLRFGDLEEFILEKLEKGLPKNLYYHNLKHTIDVYTQVELIGRSEKVSQEEQLLLQTAALFHDAGHLIDYDTHEEMGVKLAREILPEYYYTERQIEIISDLIMVTKLPPKPKNLLEEIMCDADLDYLGRADFIPVSNMLYKELHEHGRIGTIHEWNELQIQFIEKHQYFTNTARRLRNINKNSQLDNIKAWNEKNKL